MPTRVNKRVLDTARLRQIPRSGFSWIDRRFVREGFLEELPPEAALLYLFLVAVSDAKGLSFYCDATIGRLLKLDAEQLSQSRARLRDRELILYEYPLYQVLELPSPACSRRCNSQPAASPRPAQAPCSQQLRRGGEAMSIRELFAEMLARDTSQGRGARP